MPYLNASAAVIHYDEALYQMYAPYLYLFNACSQHVTLSYQIFRGNLTGGRGGEDSQGIDINAYL